MGQPPFDLPRLRKNAPLDGLPAFTTTCANAATTTSTSDSTSTALSSPTISPTCCADFTASIPAIVRSTLLPPPMAQANRIARHGNLPKRFLANSPKPTTAHAIRDACRPILAKQPLKRINMALRWLVRRDGIVDLGVWESITPAQLYIPSGRTCRQHGSRPLPPRPKIQRPHRRRPAHRTAAHTPSRRSRHLRFRTFRNRHRKQIHRQRILPLIPLKYIINII